MRMLLIFVSIAAFGLCLLLFGNMLRCASAKPGSCPGWCALREVRCLSSAGDCQPQACRAPSWSQYRQLADEWRRRLNFPKP